MNERRFSRCRPRKISRPQYDRNLSIHIIICQRIMTRLSSLMQYTWPLPSSFLTVTKLSPFCRLDLANKLAGLKRSSYSWWIGEVADLNRPTRRIGAARILWRSSSGSFRAFARFKNSSALRNAFRVRLAEIGFFFSFFLFFPILAEYHSRLAWSLRGRQPALNRSRDRQRLTIDRLAYLFFKALDATVFTPAGIHAWVAISDWLPEIEEDILF